METTSCDYREETKKKCFIYVESMRRPSPSKLMGGRHSIGSTVVPGLETRNLLKQNMYDGLGTATDM